MADRDFIARNAGILFRERIKQSRGVMSLFGLESGYVKDIQFISYHVLVIRVRESSGQ